MVCLETTALIGPPRRGCVGTICRRERRWPWWLPSGTAQAGQMPSGIRRGTDKGCCQSIRVEWTRCMVRGVGRRCLGRRIYPTTPAVSHISCNPGGSGGVVELGTGNKLQGRQVLERLPLPDWLRDGNGPGAGDDGGYHDRITAASFSAEEVMPFNNSSVYSVTKQAKRLAELSLVAAARIP